MSEEETLLEVRRMVVVVDMVWAGSGEGSRVWRRRCSECMPWTSGGGGYCVEPSLFPTSAVSPILLRVLPLWLPMIALWSAEGKGPVKNEERMEFGGRRAGGDRDVFALIAYGAPRATGEDSIPYSMRDGDGDALPMAGCPGGCQRGEAGSVSGVS